MDPTTPQQPGFDMPAGPAQQMPQVGLPVAGGGSQPMPTQPVPNQSFMQGPISEQAIATGAMHTQGTAVDRAISTAIGVVARTQNNPLQQSKELGALRTNYLKEQFGIDMHG